MKSYNSRSLKVTSLKVHKVSHRKSAFKGFMNFTNFLALRTIAAC